MNVLDTFLSVLAPAVCVGCRTEGAALCAACCERLDTVPSVCYVCLKPSKHYKPCPRCMTQASPEYVWMSTWYETNAKRLIQAYKFDGQRSAAKIIAACMDAALPGFAEPPLVTFVPTSSTDVRSRGFDHAAFIARELARIRRLPYDRLLNRMGKTQQHLLGRDERKRQVRGAFRVRHAALVRDRDILVIDDVLTTGATIEACTRELKKAGARSVSTVVFARTPKH